MRSFKKPTNELVDRALALMTDPEHRRYFLDSLQNPNWVRPLYDQGFFREAPEPVHHEDEGTISFPIWAESRYLARIAGQAGDTVLAIIEEMPDTENVRVHEDCVDALLAMPASLAAQAVPHVIGWIDNAYHLLLPEKLGSLVEKLINAGQSDAAFRLAGRLLDLAPAEPRGARGPDGTPARMDAVPKAQFDVWEYSRIVKEKLPALMAADTHRAISLLCDKLETAIRIQQSENTPARLEDHSLWWRPAIERHGQNLGMDLTDCLVDGIRDGALSAVAEGRERARRVLDELESRQYKVFRRIALHVLCEAPDADRDRLEARLRDRSLFEDPGVWHEYYRLLGCHFGQLGPDAQREILGWVDEDGRPRDGDSEEDAQRSRCSQLRPLTAIRESLPEDWQGMYNDLLEEFGEPEHPDFHVWAGSSFVGPTSPQSAQDLLVLSDKELIAFLGSWVPSRELFSPSPRGLGRALGEAASRDPERFAALAPMMQEGIDPTYVAELLSGLVKACRDEREFNWGHVVQLCAYIVRHPPEHSPILPDSFHADQDWAHARQEATRLLSQGMQERETEIPFRFRTEVWQALEQLTDDPDPTPEHETKYGGGNLSPHELAINTVRGGALEAAVLYGLWCMRHLRPRDSGIDQPPILDELPEVKEVLERHLDPAVDPSPAVRSMYGRFLPWLVMMDASWTRSRLSETFPTQPDLSHLRDAAWDTYIVFCRPYDAVFDVIEGEYRAAVRRLTSERGEARPRQEPGEHLGEHLIFFYTRGKVSLDADDSVVREFFERAPLATRANVIGSAGWQLRRAADTIAPEVVERLCRLWEFRVSVAAHSPEGVEPTELLEFGCWFASAAFEPGWSLITLQTMLRITGGRVGHGKDVLERLASLAQAYPGETTAVLAAMVNGDKQGLEISWWADEIRTVLAAGISSPEEEVRKAASHLVNRLGSRGFHQFRDLLEQGDRRG